jgi:hypothetical protein
MRLYPEAVRRQSQLVLAVVAIASSSACNGTHPTADVTVLPNERVLVVGLLRLAVSDAVSPGGILFARPSASAADSTVTVTSTRYGSLCQYDVSGHADVSASAITLHVAFVERLTVCTAEIRSLTYRAAVSGLAKGAYDLHVIHEESGRQDTTVAQSIVVK